MGVVVALLVYHTLHDYLAQVLAKELLEESDEMCEYALYILGRCALFVVNIKFGVGKGCY